MCGEGGDAGWPEAAMCAGLHTHGQSVEARLRGTVVVHGIREKVSNAPHGVVGPLQSEPQTLRLCKRSHLHLQGLSCCAQALASTKY